MITLVVDAYDSFVHIIAQYLAQIGAEPRVLRHDVVSCHLVAEMAPDAILLGPGPGHPSAVGYLELINEFAGRIPIIGVCLGHQAIGMAFGGCVVRADHVMHGKTSRIRHDANGCFSGLPNPLIATRYHSLVVDRPTVRGCLSVTATADDDGYVMGLRHQFLPIESIQFHPESYRTEDGAALLRNFYQTHVTVPLAVNS